ncbi:MAG: helix-turn-helix domain-containing protein [Gemmataceae bacterium]|nr:helix-turn-helix domain-containing protein [Gemmataceae bacterium]
MPRTKKKPPSQTDNSLPVTAAEVLTLADAAAYLRLTPEEVLRLVREQGLPGRHIGLDWRFLKAAVQDWLRAGPGKKGLFRHIGALPEDPQEEEMLKDIYRRRRCQPEEV